LAFSRFFIGGGLPEHNRLAGVCGHVLKKQALQYNLGFVGHLSLDEICARIWRQTLPF
jgi:hypothetical protein